VLRTYVRNDQYTIEYGEGSRLEVPIGSDLKDEYGFGCRERLRLEVAGNPKWSGEQGRLELVYDELADTFGAFQPVTVDDSRLDSPLASEEAALDVGGNNLVACTFQPAPNTSTTDAISSIGSAKPLSESRNCKHSSKTSGSPASASTACTENARADATTYKMPSLETSWNACILKVFPRFM
jgi:hypothetical protein